MTEQNRHGSLDLLEAVTKHMREQGVRRVWIRRAELELEVELDPAAQLLPQGGSDTEPAPAPEEKPAGACAEPRCDAPGGHLGSAYCRPHFQKAMNGQ